MAETAKKDPYGMIVDAIEKSQLTDEELSNKYPNIWSWFNSSDAENSRRKRLDMLLGDPEMQREFRKFDDFADFDFSGYKEPPKDAYKKGDLATASMKDVKDFYDRAKRTIDPNGLLGKTELYETAGPGTFEQLEEKIGPNYEGDWFGNLLDEFGYPDTPEGMEQLTQDFQAALTRTKNSKFGDKFGSAKAPLKFLFTNSFNVLDDGKKPTIGDVAVDAGTNAAMAVPAAKMFPMLGGALRFLPKGAGAAEIALKANAPKTILGKIGKSLATAGAVPTASQAADYAFGTDTEKEKKEGVLGRAVAAGTGTLVNAVTPWLLSMSPNRVLPLLGLRPKDSETVRQGLGDLIFHGGRAGAAKAKLAELAEDAVERKDVALEFAKRLSGKEKAGPDELSAIIAGFGRRLEKPATELARAIESAGGKVDDGIMNFLTSGRDNIAENTYEKLAQQPTNALTAMMPYLSAYVVNRLGTGKVAKSVKGMLGSRFGRFVEDDEEE